MTTPAAPAAEEVKAQPQSPPPAEAKPPSTPPPAPAAEEKKSSPESRRKMLGIMLGAEDQEKAAKPDEAKAGEAKADGKDKAPKEEKPKEEKRPAKAKQKPIEDLEDQDPEELIQRTAQETGKAVGAAVVEANRKAQPQPEKAAEPELPEEEQDLIPVYQHLEKASPKYKGLVAKVTEFKRKGGTEDQYRAKWEAEHPDEEFDSEDKQHSAWYLKNAPPEVSDRDFNSAQKDLLKEELRQETRRENDKREHERFREETTAKIEPMAVQVAQGLYGDSLRAFPEELSKQLLEAGQKGGAKAIAEIDPIAASVVEEVVPNFQPLAAEVVRVYRGGSVGAQPTALQAKVIEIAVSIEDHMATLPASQTIRETEVNGRTVKQKFLPMERYAQVPPADRHKYYAVGMEEVLGAIIQHTQKVVGAKYKERMDLVDRVSKKTTGGKSDQAASNGKPAEPKEEKPRTASPSVSGTSPAPPTSTSAKDAGATARERMGKVLGW